MDQTDRSSESNPIKGGLSPGAESKPNEKTDSMKTLNSSYSNVYVSSTDTWPQKPTASEQPSNTNPVPTPIYPKPTSTAPIAQSSAAQSTSPTTKAPSKAMPNVTAKRVFAELGPVPVVTFCHQCRHMSLTKTKPACGIHVAASLACCCCCTSCVWFWCWALTIYTNFYLCGLAFTPALIQDVYDIDHYCRNCNIHLGRYTCNVCTYYRNL